MANELDATLPSLELTAVSSVYAEDGQDLIEKVRRKLQDDSYSADDILDEFNQCLVTLAGEFLLPELDTWVELTTDTSGPYIHLPADYHRHLRRCHSDTHNRNVKVYGSQVQLYRQFRDHDQHGRVIGVAVRGRRLYYQRIPQSAETLEVNYWRYPDRITARYQKPTCLPPHLAEPLLVAYACKELFAEIEDGIEGAQVNTERWEKKYMEAKAQLLAFVGPEERVPVEPEEEIDWDWMAYS